MTHKTEQIIKQDVIKQLSWDERVDDTGINVDFNAGKVILKGKVTDQNQKRAAERDCYLIKGVKSVNNLLDVELEPNIPLPNDEEIAENIRKIISWSERTTSADIDVRVERGIVTLEGTAKSGREKKEVENIANSVPGVISVLNHIRIVPFRKFMDEDIKQDIKNAYTRSILVDESRIDVEVNNGIVYLTGNVANSLIKDEAHEIALNTGGAKDVVDDIIIG